MSIVSAVVVLLAIVGLAILTGFLISAGLTTGAIGSGLLCIILSFLTFLGLSGVRTAN